MLITCRLCSVPHTHYPTKRYSRALEEGRTSSLFYNRYTLFQRGLETCWGHRAALRVQRCWFSTLLGASALAAPKARLGPHTCCLFAKFLLQEREAVTSTSRIRSLEGEAGYTSLKPHGPVKRLLKCGGITGREMREAYLRTDMITLQ